MRTEEKSGNEDSIFNLSRHPGLQSFIDLNPPAKYKTEAENYFSTSEVLQKSNDLVNDEDLTEPAIYQLLLEQQYELVKVDDLQLWMTK